MPAILPCHPRGLLAAGTICCLVLPLAACSRPPQTPEHLHRRVNSVFARWDWFHTPGCALGVVRDQALVYARGYGLADLERGTPITSRTLFDLASDSKQFTAMCVLLQAQRGRLSLEDDLHEYLPELPDYGVRLTLRHLLHHTDGLPDYPGLMSAAGMSEYADYPDAVLLGLIAAQRRLLFAPGERYLYGDTGYYLLGRVVERTSGGSLRQFAEENVFRPLGMRDTFFHDDTRAPVPGLALGYSSIEEGRFRIDMSRQHFVGDGGVLTDIEDLARWDRNFYDNRLGGGPALITQMLATEPLRNGLPNAHAAGLTVSTYRGLPQVSHTGAWTGYSSEMLRFPTRRLSIFCLCNVGDADPRDLAHAVADLYLDAPWSAVGFASP